MQKYVCLIFCVCKIWFYGFGSSEVLDVFVLVGFKSSMGLGCSRGRNQKTMFSTRKCMNTYFCIENVAPERHTGDGFHVGSGELRRAQVSAGELMWAHVCSGGLR